VRAELMDECLDIVTGLWAGQPFAYTGRHYTITPTEFPTNGATVQQPRVPIWLGAGPGPRNYAHLVEYADGWIPIGGRGLTQAVPHLRRAFDEAGRDIAGFDLVPFGSTPDAKKFEHFQSLGVTEVVAYAPPAGRDHVLAFLQSYARTVEEFSG